MPANDASYNQGGPPPKWRGILLTSIRKVQKQVHPSLSIDLEALEYLEDLIMQLLNLLCTTQPRSIIDVEERVQKTFPQQINDWAVVFAQSTIEKGKRKNALTLSVDKLHPYIQKEILGYKIEHVVSLYTSSVLEYISADILKLAGNYVKNIRHDEITRQDVKVAMGADKVLMDMFHADEMEPSFEPSFEPLVKRGSLVYDEILKDFMMSEEQYLRELNLIIKVFRQPFLDASHLFTEEDVDEIFSNILDLYEFSQQFYSMLEATVEMAREDSGLSPLIGDCFQEMAEGAEFDVYETYALEQLDDRSERRQKLGIRGSVLDLLERPGTASYFQKFELKDAISFILPKLLYLPIFHCLEYFEYMKLMMTTSPDGEDREKLDDALSVLRSLQVTMERVCNSPHMKRKPEDRLFYQRHIGVTSHSSVSKLNDIQKNIDSWEGKDICQCCSEFLKEGQLIKPAQYGRKGTERYVVLMDSLLICCKQNSRHSINALGGAEYRLKEKFFLRKIEIRNLDDNEEYKHAFEVIQRGTQPFIYSCKTEEEKSNWMAALMTLQLRSTLDRMLNALLTKEEQLAPLRLPDIDQYRFVEEDTEDNIVFEEGQEDDTGAPVIKGGSLYKLVERLTYHKYADTSFVRVFLTTYRSFCQPSELLDLLIVRYEIPEPPPNEKDRAAIERGQTVVREDLKRFRKDYAYPIQLRVMNVIRHWVDQHFYDFEREPDLLLHLNEFFCRIVKTKAVKKWVESIDKLVQRRTDSIAMGPEQYSFSLKSPPVEWHLTRLEDQYYILTLHPLEIGRQLTLMESEMFRSIRPSELVGSAWTKKDKDKTSPNALKMIRFSNKITYWFMVNILEAKNFEERVAVFNRILEILMVFQELNNFNGLMEVVSAMNSASVYRLYNTLAEIPLKKIQAFDEAKELADNHNKKYIEKLRSINPPCVPFLGMYLSNILKIEEGNPDFIPNHPEGIINFNKRRKVADITGEIQQYQNQPYNLEPESSIMNYFEELDPIRGRNEKDLNDYLYEMSLEIEPRNSKTPTKFPRSNDVPLKSPGIKPTPVRPSQSSTPRKGSVMSVSLADLDAFAPSPSQGRKGPSSPSLPEAPGLASDSQSLSSDLSRDEAEDAPPAPLPRLPIGHNRRASSPHEKQQALPPRRELGRALSERVQSSSPPVLPPRSSKPSGVHSLPLSSRAPDSPTSSVSFFHNRRRQLTNTPPSTDEENEEGPPPIPPRPHKISVTHTLSDDAFDEETVVSSSTNSRVKIPPAIPPKVPLQNNK